MTVKEVVNALGSWEVTLSDRLPEEVRTKLDFFAHVAFLRGRVDVSMHSNDDLLRSARYVGVVRSIDLDETRTIGGESLELWLGDEDEKGEVFESKLVLTNATLATCVAQILPDALTVGTVFAQPVPAQRFTDTFQFVSPRTALKTVCDHFGVMYRINGDGSVDVGTQADLYTSNPDSIIVRRGAGVDMDTVAIGARFTVEKTANDYSTRVVLLGQTQADATFVTATQDAPVVPYRDLLGNPVKRTRMISESGTTSGTAAQRSQLALNRYNRTTTALRVTAEDYEIEGNFRVGDLTDVYDPDTGIVNASRERYFRGDVLHPDLISVAEITWSVTTDHTVAFRTQAGEWIDLTPWVEFETGSNEIVVGDLPRSLTKPGSNPVLDRADALPDASVPAAPTGLTLATTAFVGPTGKDAATVLAAWTAPTANTDGSALVDLDHYLIQWRPQLRAPQWNTSVSATTEIDLPAVIGLVYDVRVQAVDKVGNKSAFTAISSITASRDTTAPATPSDPSVTSYLGQLRIEWDGLTSTGSAMPPDFNRVDVHVGTTAGFSPSAATLVASLSTKGVAYATAPYGVTRYVRFIAYDHTQNASAASGTVSGSTVKVNDGDVQAVSVGRLTAGIMTADVTISGRFATALTGARVEVNALGLQKWDSGNNLLVSITGTDALITGTYRSARTGRRIEMGAAGALGELNFYAPDNKKSFVRAYTESTGIEALQVGVEMPNTNSLWNRININSDEWLNIRSGSLDFTFREAEFFAIRSSSGTGLNTGQTGVTDRFYMTSDALVMMQGGCRTYLTTDSIFFQPNFGDSDEDGQIRLIKTMPGFGSTSSSAQLMFISPLGYGARLKTNMTNSPPSNLRLEVRNVNDTGYENLWCLALTETSDVRTKKNVRDLEDGALAKVRAIRPRRWQEKRDKNDVAGREHIGIVAQEAPAEVVVDLGDPDVPLGISPTALATLAIKGVQELAAIVDELRKGKP